MHLSRRLSSLVFALFMGLLIPVISHAAEMVSTSRDNVQMRTGPGTKYRPKWDLERGYPLQVISRKGSWLKVRDFESDSGWVPKSHTSRKRTYVSKVENLNIRSGPSTKRRVIGRAGYGDILRTIQIKGKWVKVSRGRTVGWVSRSLVWGW